MNGNSPILVWFRRDLRLSDHPALTAACQTGRPVIPVYVLDNLAEGLGAAPKWRLGQGLECFGTSLKTRGSRLILRRGDALTELRRLIGETGAQTVYWSRLYDPEAVSRDSAVKSALQKDGIEARSFGGHLMFEPWTVKTRTGGFYRVFSPMWKMVKTREVEEPLPEPGRIASPAQWPVGESLTEWALGAAMNRGGEIVEPYVQLGEAAALERLDAFMADGIARYSERRDLVAVDGTSRLSENLSLGEISPHRCWHSALRAREVGEFGAESFMKELVWREFAYHLMHYTPRILTGNWRPEWDAFPWNTDPTHPHVVAWKQGRTGIRMVDAAMREMYVTGRMHNRARMIAASYLTKHLMCHWKIGMSWFSECLIDWDVASNAMGWQWSAGSGPDATPYFRVFNPVAQQEKFDAEKTYVNRWIAEGQSDPPHTATSFFEAAPRAWRLSADQPYSDPIVTAEKGRAVALDAYENRAF